MTKEELNQGNWLCQEIIDAENELRDLNEWLKAIETWNEMVWISNKERIGRKRISICVLHGKKVLPLIQERIKEVEERLRKKKDKFKEL